MKKRFIVPIFTAVIMLCLAFLIKYEKEGIPLDTDATIKIGFVYIGDESTPYTMNFVSSQEAIASEFGDRVEIVAKYNVSEDNCEPSIMDLVKEDCDLIFLTSYGYGVTAKQIAEKYPDIQFCMATCEDANQDPVLPNYHNFMGEIYQGRYITGLVAGLKLKEMIESGQIDVSHARIGCVAAFPYAEVISGYTAFLLGVREIVPEATMEVRYVNTWGNYHVEKECAKKLINEGCVIITQHSDTTGPAVACEEASTFSHRIYHVGYNRSMADVAPTTSLISSRLNWTPYMMAAVEAVLAGEKIETHVDAEVNGNDAWAGFDKGWVEIVELNSAIAPKDAAETIQSAKNAFEKKSLIVFKGDYTGTDPFDPADTIDLSGGYRENAQASAPSFHYILDDVIEVRE